MAPLAEMIAYLDRLRASGDAAPDAALLRRFARDGDGAAFAALVGRHGPLVLGVCRRWLRRAEDIEDAFQATFLVLARRAGRVGQPQRLGNWLFGVALRVARRLRHREGRRLMSALPDDVPGRAHQGDDLAPILDEELAQLPERDRLALVLCCLEGRSREEAARELGATPGAVKGLLERGRRRLRQRLERRGLTAALPAPAVVPLALSRQAAEAGLAFAAGAVTSPAAQLALGVISDMFSPRYLYLAATALIGLACGVGLAMYPARQAAPVTARAPVPAADPEPVGKEVELVHKEPVYAVIFVDSGTVATATKSGDVVRWDAKLGKEKARWRWHKTAARSLALSPDGKRLASGDDGNGVVLWDIARGLPLWTSTGRGGAVTSLSFAPDGKELVAAAGDHNVWRFDPATGKQRSPHWSVGATKEAARGVVYFPDGKQLLVAGFVSLNVGTTWTAAHLVGAGTGKTTLTRPGAQLPPAQLVQTGIPTPVAVAPKGATWAVGAIDRTILLGRDGKLEGHTGAITALAFHPDGKVLLSASRDGTVRSWDIKTRKQTGVLKGLGQVEALALSADGRRVAWADARGVVKVREVSGLFRAAAKADNGGTLVGAWRTVPDPGGPAAGLALTLTFAADGKLTFDDGAGQVEFGSYKIDDTKDPPHIDYVTPARANPANGKPPLLGVYALQKDALTLYLHEKQRPAKLEAPAGSGVMKVVLRRANAG